MKVVFVTHCTFGTFPSIFTKFLNIYVMGVQEACVCVERVPIYRSTLWGGSKTQMTRNIWYPDEYNQFQPDASFPAALGHYLIKFDLKLHGEAKTVQRRAFIYLQIQI